MLTAPLPVEAAQGDLIRLSPAGGSNGTSSGASVSADGRFVVFRSSASNLVAGDTNGREDIFRYDRSNGAIHPVSVTSAGEFLQASHGQGVVSGDGRYVAFWSQGSFSATDPARTADVFVKDMTTGVVERVTVAPDGSNSNGNERFSAEKPLALSDDARWVIFESVATNLVAGDVDDQVADIFARDRLTGLTVLLSSEESGLPGSSSGLDAVVAGTGSEAVAGLRVLSSDRTSKRMVIYRLATREEEVLAALDAQRSRFVAVSADGMGAIISTGTANSPSHYNVEAQTSTALPADLEWTEVKQGQFTPDLALFVAPVLNAFTFRVVTRETLQYSELPRGPDGTSPNQDVIPLAISDDGSIVVFESSASNLTTGDTNALTDPFVVEIARGTFADDDRSPFEPDIEWLVAEDITRGCGIELFCPRAPVTRGQMASFLVRALELPVSSEDFFRDDEESVHQSDINALAESGLTRGCGPEMFCPEQPVSRQEMASFLARALDLPSSIIDHFIDDLGSVHEGDIDALAEAGITLGCGPGLFCPLDHVLREQMAAFLHRGFD